MSENITGLALARLFYEEAVLPLLNREMSDLRFSAGLIGWSSEVIGCDDALSRDHWWGPRCQLFLPAVDFEKTRDQIDKLLSYSLPLTFRGYSTHIPNGHAAVADGHPIAHQVHILNAEEYFADLTGSPVGQWTPAQWLTIHEHHLLGVTSGELFRDDLDLQKLRDTLVFYSDDIRLYLIAVEWIKISQEQAFPARAGMRGAEAGSAIVAAKLAESLMRLYFYLHRRYAPYSKWFGFKFLELPNAHILHQTIVNMLSASDWQGRDQYWSESLAIVLKLHEEQGLLVPGKYRTASVYDGRPGTGIPMFQRDGLSSIADLVDEIRSHIVDPLILKLPKAIGSINQISSSTDITDNRIRARKLVALYQE